jgi:hypothetical protein
MNWLCAAVRALPEGQSAAAVAALEAFVVAYGAVAALEDLAGPEAFGTAVAFVPELADLMPRPGMRQVLGREVGSNLAAAELTQLKVAVARRVAALWIDDQARVVRDLWIEAMAE